MRKVFVFLGGAAVGAAVALLLAPEKGEVTRKKIGEKLSEGGDKMRDTVEHGRERVAEAIKTGRAKLNREIEEIEDIIKEEVEV